MLSSPICDKMLGTYANAFVINKFEGIKESKQEVPSIFTWDYIDEICISMNMII